MTGDANRFQQTDCDEISYSVVCDIKVEDAKKKEPAKQKKPDFVYSVDPKMREFMVFMLCGLIQNTIGGGLLYSVGLFLKVWKDEFGVGSGVISWLGTISMGMMCLVGPGAGYLVTKFSTRPVMMVGAVIVAISLSVSAMVNNVYVLMFTYGAGCGMGVGISYTPVMAFLTQSFGKYRGIGNGLVTAGSSIGNFAVPFFVSWSLDEYGWRGSVLLLGGVSFNFLIGAQLARRWSKPITSVHSPYLLGRNTRKPSGDKSVPDILVTQPEEESDEMLVIKSLTHITVFKQTTFVYLALHSLLLYFGVSIIYVHIVPFSQEVFNLDAHRARYTISILGLSNFFGRVLVGVALQHPKVDCFSVYFFFNLSFAIVIGIFPFCEDYTQVVIVVIIMGFVLTAYGSLTNVVLADLLPEKYLLSALGYTYFTGGIGSVLGAPAAGWLYDATGDYSSSMYLGSACSFVSILIILPSWFSHAREKWRTPLSAEPVKHNLNVDKWIVASQMSLNVIR